MQNNINILGPISIKHCREKEIYKTLDIRRIELYEYDLFSIKTKVNLSILSNILLF